MTNLVTVPPIYYDVRKKGAAVDGTTDDITPITNSISALDALGGGFVFIPGTSAISTPVTLNPTNPIILCSTVGGGIKALAGFSGAQMINITKNFCGVRDLTLTGGASTTYSSNPATNGIQVTGAVGVNVQNIFIQYVNGWGFQSTATSGQANYNLVCDTVHIYSGKQGFKSLGVTGSNYNGVQHFNDCNADAIQNGDCYHFEDIEDVLCTAILGECSAGSGNAIDIKGACAAIYVSGFDIGPNPGPIGNVVLIETGTNGNPKFIGFSNGIIEGGSNGVYIGAGQQIHINACEIFNNNTGILLAGGDAILVNGCTFGNNGQQAGTGRYDINSSTGGNVEITNCHFLTPQGAGTGQTNNVMNVTAGQVVVQGNRFAGSGYTTSNIFNSYPPIVRSCPGFNPVGSFSPTLPATGVNFATNSFDATYFVTGGTVSSIKIGGVATGLTSGTFRVPAQQNFNITYTVAPTVTGFGD